ncbi:hypothetical protein BJ546DRAFT_988456, partial [Cryomyces antarcticus]
MPTLQAYIGMFGGNASQVTISGESAGGGSVMLQDMAFGGSMGTSLFVNVNCRYSSVVNSAQQYIVWTCVMWRS